MTWSLSTIFWKTSKKTRVNYPVPSSCQEIDPGRSPGIARRDVAFGGPPGVASCVVGQAELRALLDPRKPTRLDIFSHLKACESCKAEFVRLKLDGHLRSRSGEPSQSVSTFLGGLAASKRTSVPSFALASILVLTFFSLIWTATTFTIRNRS